MVRFPDSDVQRCSALAVNAVTMGRESATKVGVMHEEGLLPLMALVDGLDLECVKAGIYALGTLCEVDEVKAKLVELGAVASVVHQCFEGDIEVKRSCGYFLARLSENLEFHEDLLRCGGLRAVVELAALEDMECQEYSAFCLAHLASNRDLQVKLVEQGALKPLVSMMAVQAEPRHYAGLALLKLADNFENHVAIAKEGGIQALLRLGRTRTTDDELQYKAALTVGNLASNAVKLLPNSGGGRSGDLGTAAKSAMSSKGNHAARKGRDSTKKYLDRAVTDDDEPEMKPRRSKGRKARGAAEE